MQIREDVARYMRELKQWLAETEQTPLEEMGAFFAERLAGYEEHMQLWRKAYRRMAELVPARARELLDVGCGTGLELDELYKLREDINVTGIDLSSDMLEMLGRKHPSARLICADYLSCELPDEGFDAAISFETLHHLTPAQKLGLFTRLRRAIKPEGEYLQADYIACCAEEEALLMETLARRRAGCGVPEGRHVHFDTPLTLEHELALMRGAGFSRVEPLECIDGACIIRAIR